MSQAVTHKDLARKLKVSETTIKSYRRKFADCIPVASQGKPIRFLPEAVPVCMRIRDLFELGMSVEEVRARLAQEFSWVSLVAKEEVEEQAPASPIPQEFAVAVSSLAKSMVNISRQQTTMIERLETIECAFASLPTGTSQEGGGMKAAEFKTLLEDLQGYLHNALLPLQQLQRLNEVQSITEMLHQAAGSMVDAAHLLRGMADRGKAEGQQETSVKKVVQFPTAQVQQAAQSQPQLQSQVQVHASQAASQDPPRAFLLKPMVVRTAEGAYIGAGGKSRGRFTLNDFKALLIYGRQSGSHSTMHWELSGAEWVATLTKAQGEAPETWQFQLKEAMSQSGVGVVELIRFTANGQALHPAEFVSFVGQLAGG